MAGSFQPYDAQPMLPGERFRVTMHIRAPYTINNVEKLESTWPQMAGIAGDVDTKQFTVTFPREGVWSATAEYVVVHRTTLDHVGSFCQNVVSQIMNATALVLVEVRKFVVDTTAGVLKGAGDALEKPLKALNPGFVALGLVGVFIIWMNATRGA